jgi:hypothetical protein
MKTDSCYRHQPLVCIIMDDSSPLPVPRTGPGDAPKDPGIASNCHQSYTEKDFEGKIPSSRYRVSSEIYMMIWAVLETTISS